MSSSRLLRQATSTLRKTPTQFTRSLATEVPQPARTPKVSPRPSGHATVEELHNQTAAEILAERDG